MIARDQLKSIVERIERLHEERKAIADDIRDMYAEAKANGFDTKVLKHVVKLRGQDLSERQEFDDIVDLYLSALGLKIIISEMMLLEFEPEIKTGMNRASRVQVQEAAE